MFNLQKYLPDGSVSRTQLNQHQVLDAPGCSRQCCTISALSDLSVLNFYLNKSPYLGLSIKKRSKWRIRHCSGCAGAGGGVRGAVWLDAQLYFTSKSLVFKSPNICSLGARSALQTLFGCLLSEWIFYQVSVSVLAYGLLNQRGFWCPGGILS